MLRFTYIRLRFELVFYLAVTGWERDIVEFGSEIVLRYSSIGVQNIIFDFKFMINESISAKETCRVNISTSWNERRNSALVQMQNNFAEIFLIMLSNKIALS